MTQNNRGGFLNDAGAPVQPAGDSSQAALDAQWWKVVGGAHLGTGIVTGGMVSAAAAGGLAVDVDPCNASVQGVPVSTPAATVAFASNATGLRRFDLLVIRDGALTKVQGVADAIPCFPALATDPGSGELTDVAVAAVLVYPGATVTNDEDVILLGIAPSGATTARPQKAASFLPFQRIPTGAPNDYAVLWSYNGRRASHLNTGVQDNVVTTSDGAIYSIFVNESKNVTVTQHLPGDDYCTAVNLGDLPNDPFETGTEWTTDAHDFFSLGVTPDGFLHISGNMHAQTLKYCRAPLATFSDLNTWTYPTALVGPSGHRYLAMVGDHEVQDAVDGGAGGSGDIHGVTYPTFIRLSNGVLVFVYRWGRSGSGDIYINRWNNTTHAWARVGKAVDELTPDVGDGQNWNAYPQKIVPGDDRDIHYMYMDRNTGSETTNVGMFYARFTNLDGVGAFGAQDSAGNAKVLPLVHDPSFAANRHAEVASPTAPTVAFPAPNLLNGGGLCIDRDGYPHACISYRADTSSQYQNWHLWRSSTGWHKERITQFGGAGRNHIFTTPAGETFIVGTGPGGIVAWNCTPGGTRESFRLSRFDEAGEITYDTRALYEHGLLRMLIAGGQGFYEDGGDNDIPANDGATPPVTHWANGVAALTLPRTVCGILTIDLTQIDAFRNGTAHLPGINVIASASFRDRASNKPVAGQGSTPGDGWQIVGSGDAVANGAGNLDANGRIATSAPILVSHRAAARILFVKQSALVTLIPNGQWASTCVIATDTSDPTDNIRRLAPLWWQDTEGDLALKTTTWCGLHEFAPGNKLGWATGELWCSGGSATYIAAMMLELGELDLG